MSRLTNNKALFNFTDALRNRIEQLDDETIKHHDDSIRAQGQKNTKISKELIFASHNHLRQKAQAQEEKDKFHKFIIPEVYEPANPSISLDKLKKIQIKDLRLGKHHKGTYLKVRVVAKAFELECSLQTVVEDEQGSHALLRLYFRDTKFRPSEHLPPTQVLAIRDPFFWSCEPGDQVVRVDHPYDMQYLYPWEEPGSKLIPINWRQNMLDEGMLVDHLIQLAEVYFDGGETAAALMRLNQAEATSKKPKNKTSEYMMSRLKLGRAKVNMRLGRHILTAADIEYALKAFPDHEEAMHLRALRLYYTGRYDLCKEALEKLRERFPKNVKYIDLELRTKQRFEELKRGSYNWRSMRRESLNRPFNPSDHADYTNAVKLKKTPKGRRIFTARDLKRGDLVMVVKAAAAIPFEEKLSVYMMMWKEAKPEGEYGISSHLTGEIMDYIRRQPPGWYEKNLMLMTEGTFNTPNYKLPDGSRVPDIFHIEDIRNANKVNITIHPVFDHSEAYLSSLRESDFISGFWVLPSYLRHSCIPNAHRTVIGDMMIIRAGGDIPANTKVTINCRTPSVWNYADFEFDCTCPIHKYDYTAPGESDDITILRAVLWGQFVSQAKVIDQVLRQRDKKLKIDMKEALYNLEKILDQLKSIQPPPSKMPPVQLLHRYRYVASLYFGLGDRRHTRCALYRLLDAHGVEYDVDEEEDSLKIINHGSHPTNDLMHSYLDLSTIAQTPRIKKAWYTASVSVYEILYGEKESFVTTIRGQPFKEAKVQCGCIGVDNFWECVADEQTAKNVVGYTEAHDAAYKEMEKTTDGKALIEMLEKRAVPAALARIRGEELREDSSDRSEWTVKPGV
ncbi:hypothetical protein ABW19_dt0205906 [Dactylella cylindrospora]|nr:hypothetical protein ABW19_dt0205906 [Dactylella cylindrospora]